MVGGATPDTSGDQLLLSMRRMNRIRSCDKKTGHIVAEAGVILANLHSAAEKLHLRFPLTLGGKGSATIGGLISTNAGGTQVVRHGTMRSLLEGIEVILADGQIFDDLSPLKKDNRGYDMRHLLCGAEGTLGIVTAATLKLVPVFALRCVAWIGTSSPESALVLFERLKAKLPDHLEGFELIPHVCLTHVLRYIPQTRAPLLGNHPWHILIELVGDEADRLEDRLVDLAAEMTSEEKHRAAIRDLVVAKSESAADAFWRIRDSISEAERTHSPALQHDVSVPIDKMPIFIAENARRLAKYFPGISICSFGHLGDGNVHHHVQPPPDHSKDDKGVHWLRCHEQEIGRIVYSHALELGGSLSAEHGIGQMKRTLLAELSSSARIAMLRGIKNGLDPKALFNPGKLVP